MDTVVSKMFVLYSRSNRLKGDDLTLSKTHIVDVRYPVIGSDFYAIMQSTSIKAIKFVAVKDGQPAYTHVEKSYQTFLQGKDPDKVGNKEVFHSYLEGQITVLPQTDKVWSFNVTTADTYNSSTSYRSLLVEGRGKLNVLIKRIVRNSTDYTNVHGSDTHQSSYFEFANGKRFQEQDTECSFVVDYSHIENSTATISHTVSGKNSLGDYAYADDPFTVGCDVVYLGKVTANHFNDHELRLATERVRSTNAPTSFLTDLYEKLGTPQVNNYGNIAAAKKWRQMIPPILDVIKKHNVKSVSDLYLWWKYSYNTSKMDIEAYVQWFKMLAKAKSNPADVSHYSLYYKLAGNDIVRYNIYLSPYSIGVLEALGLDINFVNTWDLIPFSFVIDWFVSVEETLKSLDVADLESKIDLISLLTTHKDFAIFIPRSPGNWAGDLNLSYFHRTCSKTLPRDVCDLHFNDPSSHLLDASSLIVSCKKK